jgi:chromosome partitioning protein
VIHEHESLREAAGYGQPIIEYAPSSPAEQDFQALADWLEEHPTRPAVEIEVMAAAAPDESPLRRRGRDPAPESSQAPRPGSGSVAPGDSNGGGRAAELAARVRELVHPEASELVAAGRVDPHRAAHQRSRTPPSVRTAGHLAPGLCATIELPSTDVHPGATMPDDPGQPGDHRLAHLFGARQTAMGVLFVQPGEIGARVSVAGDFNHWSPDATPLRHNPRLNVHEAVVFVPPGRHQYRLVVDGRWRADPFNEQQTINAYDERNSVLMVTGAEAGGTEEA